MMVADLVFWPTVAFLVGCSLYFGPRLGSRRVAMQWGLDGEPTWYAPKAVGLWGMVAFAVIVRLLIFVASTYAPKNVHGAEIGLLLFSVVTAVAHLMTLRRAARAN